jgi:hypothetical protein
MTLKIESAFDGKAATLRLSGRIEEDHLAAIQEEVRRYRPHLVARLITAAGFDPVKVGGVEQAIRIEFGGDLSEFGLNGRLPTTAEAEALIGAQVH